MNSNHWYESRQLDPKYFENLKILMKEAWKVYNALNWKFKNEITTLSIINWLGKIVSYFYLKVIIVTILEWII